MSVVLIGTLDTKGREIAFVRAALARHGAEATIVDAGALGEPAIEADISRAAVFEAAGTTLAAVAQKGDRGEAVALAAVGVERIVCSLHAAGKVSGVLGLGGSAGTTIATRAMRALPFGVPKLMVSTLASGQVRPFVGPRDIMMFHSVTDISGINRISATVLGNAAAAMAGMVTAPPPPLPYSEEKPLLTATMFGVTTPCVEASRALAEQKGYEMLVFHAVGTGGEAMESLIADGLIAGVLDVTTTELADELVGGVLSAGPDRLTAASKLGVPQVISVGAVDMVNFGPANTIPEKFFGRKFYMHNPSVTLMRTTPEENERIGADIGAKAAAALGPTAVALPLRGVSAIDAPGQPFWDPDADRALFASLRRALATAPTHVQLLEFDLHLNDPAFAAALVETLGGLMRKPS